MAFWSAISGLAIFALGWFFGYCKGHEASWHDGYHCGRVAEGWNGRESTEPLNDARWHRWDDSDGEDAA